MWLSKAELTQEIQRLGTLCEERTKELNHLKMETKHVTTGFDAFASLFRYMVEDLNALSMPKLNKDLEKTLKQLELTKQDLAFYERQVEELKAHHRQELNEISSKLFEVCQSEVTELNAKHTEEINHLIQSQKKKLIAPLKEEILKLKEANKNKDEIITDLKNELQEQLVSEVQYLAKLSKMIKKEIDFRRVQDEMQNQLKDLPLLREKIKMLEKTKIESNQDPGRGGFNKGKDFQGEKINVQLAQRKSLPFGGGPGGCGGDGRGGGRGGGGGLDDGEHSDRGSGGGGGGGGSGRDGDWRCSNPEFGNNNFAWRVECNRSGTPRSEGGASPEGGSRGPGGGGGRGSGMRGGRGGDRGGGPPGMGGRGGGGFGRGGDSGRGVPMRGGPGGGDRRLRPY